MYQCLLEAISHDLKHTLCKLHDHPASCCCLLTLGIWKRYRAVLNKPLMGKEAAAVTRRFASGALQLVGDRTPLLPAGLTMVDDVTAEVALCEGRYHQVGFL